MLQITMYWWCKIYGKHIIESCCDNLAGGIHKIKCKYRRNNEKCETCGIK